MNCGSNLAKEQGSSMRGEGVRGQTQQRKGGMKRGGRGEMRRKQLHEINHRTDSRLVGRLTRKRYKKKKSTKLCAGAMWGEFCGDKSTDADQCGGDTVSLPIQAARAGLELLQR